MSDVQRTLLDRLGAIGYVEGDSEPEKLRKKFLVYMGTFMSGGGVLWGSIAAAHRQWLPAIVPYGYTALTIVNLSLFWLTKRFAPVRFVQVLISLLLPFLFQWTLGGWASSGTVMIWAMLAIVGAMTFSEARQVIGWLGLYAVLVVLSAMIDRKVHEVWDIGVSPAAATIFWAINLAVVSSLVFGLMIYLGFEREKVTRALEEANDKISQMNERLEDEVAARTRELQSSLSQSRAILDNMADGMTAVMRDGQVQAANPALSKLLFIEHEVAMHRAADVLPPVLVELADRCIQADAVEKIDLSLPGDRTGAAVASPIHAGKDCIGSVVIVRDVTLEKEIDRMKTDFIATVSHELRTPLTSVLGFAKVTKNKLQQAIFPLVPEADRKARKAVEQVSGNIDIIVSEGERLTSLINDVLDISKMEAGRMEWKMVPVDPKQLVGRAIESTRGLFTADVELKAEVGEKLPQLEGDYDRLLQVLINLISNASKFTTLGSVTVGAQKVTDGVEFSVTDTGGGIDLADHDAIFEKFRQVGDTLTSKPKGTGLGLPICKQIVTAHQGRIGVQSKLGAGSRFFFFIPGEAPISSQPTHKASPAETAALLARIEKHVNATLPAKTGGDILVVDDDKNLRELVRQQLTERGYTVRQAEDGQEAIREVRNRRPDLIILDVMMPGISGFDVAAVLKSDPGTRNVPIIILSIVQEADRGYGLGVDKYLTKPAEAEVLADEVKRLVRQGDSPRRVLVVNEQMPAAPDIVRLLETKGYDVVGTCSAQDFVHEAKKAHPDLIILEAGHPSRDDIVRAIRLEKDLQNVYVVQLVSREANGAN
ncbi:MAG: response regulator [Deltaproteobacteria bacterium]|nr:response regulator [Deltaproteobacteria bacterium]